MCTPLRAVHARDQRHGRAAGDRPRHARGDRHLSRRAVQQQAGGQRRRSVPGRRPVQQGFSVQAARVVAEDEPTACARTAARAAASTSIRTTTASIACGRGRIRRRRGLHVRRGPVRLEVHAQRRSGSRCPSSAATARLFRAIGTSSCRRCARRSSKPRRKQAKKASRPCLSPWMTLEEAYLLASYLKSLSPNVALAMGPVRVVGEDDKYPKDVHGQPMEPVKFTIRAEKCPNRRGVEAMLRALRRRRGADGRRAGPGGGGRFRRGVPGRRRSGRVGSPTQQAAALENVDTVDRARHPAVAGEPAGDVRAARRLVRRARRHVRESRGAGAGDSPVDPRSPGEAKPDGRILWDLAGRRGLVQRGGAAAGNGARRFASLRPLAVGELGEYGVRLDVG